MGRRSPPEAWRSGDLFDLQKRAVEQLASRGGFGQALVVLLIVVEGLSRATHSLMVLVLNRNDDLANVWPGGDTGEFDALSAGFPDLRRRIAQDAPCFVSTDLPTRYRDDGH